MFEKIYKYQDIKNLKISVTYNKNYKIEGICLKNPKLIESFYTNSTNNCLSLKLSNMPKSFSSIFFITSNLTSYPLSNDYDIYISPHIIDSINVIKSDYESLLLFCWIKKYKNSIPDDIFNIIKKFIKGCKFEIPVIIEKI